MDRPSQPQTLQGAPRLDRARKRILSPGAPARRGPLIPPESEAAAGGRSRRLCVSGPVMDAVVTDHQNPPRIADSYAFRLPFAVSDPNNDMISLRIICSALRGFRLRNTSRKATEVKSRIRARLQADHPRRVSPFRVKIDSSPSLKQRIFPKVGWGLADGSRRVARIQ